MKDLRVIVTIKNNRLIERRERLGLTQKQVADAIPVSIAWLQAYERLEKSPLASPRAAARTGTPWRPSAIAIAEFYGDNPEDVFPDFALEARRTRKEVHLDVVELAALRGPALATLLTPAPELEREVLEVSAAIEEVISDLKPREQVIIRERFGFDGDECGKTLEAIAHTQGVSKDRIRQIEAKALRKLRHPSRRQKILLAWGRSESVCRFCGEEFSGRQALVDHVDDCPRRFQKRPTWPTLPRDLPAIGDVIPEPNYDGAPARLQAERPGYLADWLNDAIADGRIELVKTQLVREAPLKVLTYIKGGAYGGVRVSLWTCDHRHPKFMLIRDRGSCWEWFHLIPPGAGPTHDS